jgi:hypothetical protein
MDAQQIISTVRSGQVPSTWNVWPLNVTRVRHGLLGWAGTALIGFVLLVPAALATIPSNFESGTGRAVFTVLLLGLLGMLAFGGLGILLFDIWRLLHADDYYIVMTPDDFVKITPRKIVHVPMENVRHVTLRGRRGAQQQAAEDVATLGGSSRGPAPSGSIAISPFFRSRQPRTSPSLAFMDSRDDSVVAVARDDSFEDLGVMEQILSDHAARKQRSVRSA